MRLFVPRFALLFVLAFIVSLPFDYAVLPNTGFWLKPIFEGITTWLGVAFQLNAKFTNQIASDTSGMYLHTGVLLFGSAFAATLWCLFDKSKCRITIWLLRTIAAYYLALQLFKYGFDKLFKHQFYLPEPNILYTPTGFLSKDILYWSAMGASYFYVVFMGLFEILPAVLLLFARTRLLGTLVALAVLLNVLMTNIGFNISVKLYTLFLLLLCVIVIQPDWGRLRVFFWLNRGTERKPPAWNPLAKRHRAGYALAKAVLIGIILFESLFIYFQSGNFNDDIYSRPYLHGAYQVKKVLQGGKRVSIENEGAICCKRLFIHRKNRLILQLKNEQMRNYKFQYDLSNHRLVLEEQNGDKTHLNFTYDTRKGELHLNGIVGNDSLEIYAVQLDLDSLPLLKPYFNWTIDHYE